MRKLSFMILTFLFLFVPIVQSTDEIGVAPVGGEQLARRFVVLLVEEQFEKATGDFDENMTAAVPPPKLKAIWIDQLNRFGACQRIQSTRNEIYQQYRFVFVTCQFEKQQMDVKVVVDEANKIAGFFLEPTFRPPAYAKSSLFSERDVTVGAGEWVLPGTLSIPVGKGPFPGVVLVHGSGPNDRDESIGPNKPFRDLAWGLASRGVVVLRYEKRTKQYVARFVSSHGFTVKEETIEDAVEAFRLLSKTDAIDTKRIFVLGHSLGGMLVPRIWAGNPSIAGFIVMAGPARPLEDLILEQNLYQASLVGELSAADKNKLEEARREVAAVKRLSSEAVSKDPLLGLPISYWLDLRGYDPPALASTLNRPFLILQGGKDWQVNPKNDFERWKQVLSGRKDVVSKTYPTLNHFFMEVDFKSTGAEYQKPGNVSETVVNDIATWIKKY